MKNAKEAHIQLYKFLSARIKSAQTGQISDKDISDIIKEAKAKLKNK